MENLSTGQKIGVAAAILVVGFFFIFGGTIINLFENNLSTAGASTPMENSQANQTATSTQQFPPVTQLEMQDLQVGTGTVAAAGDTVTVNYVGELTDGSVFDSSVARNQPFTFTLGSGQVIPGWDQGLVGMKVGGVRILAIPPSLGYGSTAYGPIPANSTLIFQVQLLKVESAAK